MSVTQLGYLGFEAKDLDGWLDVGVNVLGFEARPRASAEAPLYFRIDERHHRFALKPGPVDRFAYVGWEVGSLAELETLAEAVRREGLTVTEGTQAECEERHVMALVRFNDIEGYCNELYFGPAIDEVPFHAGRGIAGFETGRLGLGHIVSMCKNYDAMVDFYVRVLGFKLSDYIIWEGAHATFLHCNPRHHSLALMNECFGMKGGELNHFMIEASSLDDVGRAYDLAVDRKLSINAGMGRHTNDQTTSFYFKSPSGFGIEYGFGGLLVDDAKWEVKKYGAPSMWGHRATQPAA